jgi:diguanylate cyclase (GGDEF)-like protein
MPVTGAGVSLISPGADPHFIAASSPSALRFEQLQAKLGDGPCVAAYLSGESVLVPDLREEQRFEQFTAQALSAGLAAVFTFPLRHGESRLGALDLYRDVPGELSPASLDAAQTLADVAAAYLLNAQARNDLQDAADRSHQASLHDSLTGLPNRTLMLERLVHASRRGERSRSPMALFFVDLDQFKAVNDTHGHKVGDELLIAVAERLRVELRPGDTLARMSGDEFLVLCEDLATPAQAEAILARLDAALVAPFVLSEVTVSVTASIGTALTTPGDEPAEELIHHADLAMYRMKRRTSGTPNILNVSDISIDRDTLAAALPGALERGEFHLDYQPIVNSISGRITGVEALLRWQHPSRGLVPPALVIPIAEDTGAILAIGQWVLAQAWNDRFAWSRGGSVHGISVSVNVSAHQFMAVGFTDMVAAVLLDGVTDPSLLTLEVTESALIRDFPRAVLVLNALKTLGVKLALDDFGTGYCSLSQIMDYPVNSVKVDQRFVAGLAAQTASETIVTAVIDLAHRVDMTVVAEGVETIGQHRTLTALGTDACQGFYFARPMEASHVGALIRAGTPRHGTRLPLAG